MENIGNTELITETSNNTNSLRKKLSKQICRSSNVSTFTLSQPLDLFAFQKSEDDFSFSKLLEALKKLPETKNSDDIYTITSYISGTALMNKFKLDKEISEGSYNHLINMCSIYLSLETLVKDQVLFKIDDVGDKFYIILKGKVSILKPAETGKVALTMQQIFDYLLKLKMNEEKHILALALQENLSLLSIQDICEFDNITSFIVRYTFAVEINTYISLDDVEELCLKYQKKLTDFSITKEDFTKFKRENKFNPLYFLIELKEIWRQYVKIKMTITEKENLKYLKYINYIFNDKERRLFKTFGYQKFMSLNSGQYFGDFALDNYNNNNNNKRIATIKAECDCYLGVLTNTVYENYIQDEKHIIKTKEIAYLNNNFFFVNIFQKNFESKYFHYFSAHDYARGHQIFKEGQASKKLILIKEGFIELSFSGSLLELHEVIKILISKLFIFEYIQTYIEIKEINYFKEILNDDSFTNLRNKSKFFIKEINRKIKININIISAKDICGIEELFLGDLNRIIKANVHSLNAKVYKIQKDKLNIILDREKNCLHPYYITSVSKVVTLIKRLYQTKNSLVEKALSECRIEENNIVVNNLGKEFVLNKRLKIKKAFFKINYNVKIKRKENKDDSFKNTKINIRDLSEDKLEDNKFISSKILSTSNFNKKQKKNNLSELNSSISNNTINQDYDSFIKNNQIKKILPNKIYENFPRKDKNVTSLLSNSKVEEKLYHDSKMMKKIKTLMNEFNTQSVMINLNKTKLNKNTHSFKQEGNLFLTNIILKPMERHIAQISLIDFNINDDVIETKNNDLVNFNNEIILNHKIKHSIDFHSLNVLPKKYIPSINKLRIKVVNKLEKNKANRTTNESIDLVSNSLIKLTDNLNKIKHSVKSVKEFYNKNKLNGYRNSISVKNGMLKMQKNKTPLHYKIIQDGV